MIDFVLDIVNSFDIALDETRVAAVGFGFGATIYFRLNEFDTKHEILENAIGYFQYLVRKQVYWFRNSTHFLTFEYL